MALDGDLGVDVLIIGGGIQGLELAHDLVPRYSVCVVTDPTAPSETLDAPGHFSAGYDGNDVARIQPARRAAGYWRQWAEARHVPHDAGDSYVVLDPADELVTTRRWSDATLSVKPALALPQVFSRGILDGRPAFLVENDLVMNPTDFMAELRKGLDHRIIWGSVDRFGLATDDAIDFVEVTTGGERVVITPRFVVLGSNVGNGTLLSKVAARLKDHARRRAATEIVHTCQAVRRRLVVAVRGAALPLVSGQFGEVRITAHRFGGDEVVWLVEPPIDDRQTVLGPEDVRFEPKVDAGAVQTTLDTLFAVAPEVDRVASELAWSAYVGRKTEHPSMAVADTSEVAQPAPAKLETLDMQGLIAMWPSHLSYALITGEVVAERVAAALGEPADFSDGPQPDDWAHGAPDEQMVARWERSSFGWSDWPAFAERHDYKRN